MGKMSRDKGARFERECVNAARKKHLEARRTALSGALAHEKGDMFIWPAWEDSGAKEDGKPWPFECKRRADLPAIFRELGIHKGLIVREDGGECLAVIRYSDLLDLLQ